MPSLSGPRCLSARTMAWTRSAARSAVPLKLTAPEMPHKVQRSPFSRDQVSHIREGQGGVVYDKPLCQKIRLESTLQVVVGGVDMAGTGGRATLGDAFDKSCDVLSFASAAT